MGSKFDMSAGSPDGSVFLNGQRGPYAAASLERSGSFREAADNRFSSLLPSMSRSDLAPSQGDMNGLLQSVILNLKVAGIEQKVPRSGELWRALSSIVGVSSEDPGPALINSKPLPSSSLEELKRVKCSIIENFSRARDRAKDFTEAVSRIDKHGHALSRKRSRADISSSDRSNSLFPSTGPLKTGVQSHMTTNALDVSAQKLEERTKAAIPNRRVRTSVVEGRMDGQANANTRPPVPDKEGGKLANGNAESEEKNHALTSGVNGWEKSKLKKKRSVIKSDVSASTVSPRQLDVDREAKPGLQQKSIGDGRPRLNNGHGLRSVPPTASAGSGKLDLASQPSGVGVRPSPRNDQDISSLASDKRDRLTGLDKEGASNRTSSKQNGREDNGLTSPTPLTKLSSAARAPRSNAGSFTKTSPNMQRTVGNPDDWEYPQNMNKASCSIGTTNRKSSALQTSSSPVAQWGGQRPQMSRVARRSNFNSPLVSSHNAFAATDAAENSPYGVESLGLGRSTLSTAYQTKLKSELPSAGSSENEETGVPENKSKDKIRKCSEFEEKGGSSIHKAAPAALPSRKNKLPSEEDVGDGVRRQGRIGRGYAAMSSVMPAALEKPENVSNVKQMRSIRVGSEKIESKPGHPPNKKFSERKGHTYPRHSPSSMCLDTAGESDDDHEELLAAARAVLSSRNASDHPFWKQMDPFFGFVSDDDLAFLSEQVRQTCQPSATEENGLKLKDESEYASLPLAGSREGFEVASSNATSDIVFADEKKQDGPFLEQLVSGRGPQSGVSICQALLSAIIEDGEVGSLVEIDGNGMFALSSGSCPNVNGYLIHSSQRFLENEQLSGNLGNNKKSNLGISLEEILANNPMAAVAACSEFQYIRMSLDDRIMLELSEIGLHPEHVPDLSHREDEDISDGINSLEEVLHEKIMKKNNVLAKLEKSVMESRRLQEKEMEHIALDKLVTTAHKKYMDCLGPNTGSKHVNKNTKHAAASFAKRTLSRCRRNEQTGISCFSEAVFKEIFSSMPSRGSSGECAHATTDDELANRFSAPRQCDNIADHKACLATQSSDPAYGKEEPWLNRMKRREILLDDVVGGTVGGSSRAAPGIGSSLLGGTRGKSGRDREWKTNNNRELGSRSSTVKIGRPAVSNAGSDRKNKAKPKQQKTTHLSTTVNGLLIKDMPDAALPSVSKSNASAKKNGSGLQPGSVVAAPQALPNDAEAIDLSHLQLPELDTAVFGGQGQDIGSWLSIIDDDALQDHDFMGLEIPMDDLADVMIG